MIRLSMNVSLGDNELLTVQKALWWILHFSVRASPLVVLMCEQFILSPSHSLFVVCCQL